jgi:predicted Rossmann-fold nucleotide-binding protein
MLGERGIDILTGGGPGLMRAANEGHVIGTKKANSKAHSIGIGVRLPWNQKFNTAVEYKEKVNRFSKRLDEFMLMSNAVVVAPGGLGTMLELFYTWQLVQVHHICDIPIILMGEQWGGLLKWIKTGPLKKNYLDPIDYRLVFHARTSKEAMEIIEETYNHFKKGGKNFCLNYEKYRSK